MKSQAEGRTDAGAELAIAAARLHGASALAMDPGVMAPDGILATAELEALSAFSLQAGDHDDPGEPEANSGMPAVTGGRSVAVVTIRGGLLQHGYRGYVWSVMGYDTVTGIVREALASEAVAVVLRITSPGGTVSGLFEACRAIRALATASGKPLITYVDGYACSAGYALAAAADEIYISAEGQCGSVGVRGRRADWTGFLKERGIEVFVPVTGAAKADGDSETVLTDAERARAQATVDQFGAIFFDWVAERRGMSAEKVKGLEARVMLAPDAAKAGLVKVGSFGDAIAAALKSAKPRPSTLTGEAVAPAAEPEPEQLSAASPAPITINPRRPGFARRLLNV